MTDTERNRLSARAARYARVGANVGGVAARIAGARFFGLDLDRGRNAAGAGGGARRPQGADHEGGAAHGHHPGRAAAGIRRRAEQAAEPGAADGLGLRQAAHDGRAWRRLAAEIRRASSIIRRRRRRSGRCIARARTTARRWPASCNIPTCSRRSKPTSSSSTCSSPSTAAWTRRSTPPRSPRRSARASARSSTTSARPSTSRSTARCSTDIDLIRVPKPWPELSTGRLLTLDWLEGDPMLAHKDDALDDPQPAGAGDVHGLVVPVQPRRRDPRRSASRQLHGVHARRRARRHQPARLRLHPHLPAVASSAAWSISTTA